MVGYPRYTASGIEVTTMWNPNFLYGGSIQVLLGLKFRASQDRVPPAVGRLAFQLMCNVHDVPSATSGRQVALRQWRRREGQQINRDGRLSALYGERD
jgi:hypothetical protein